MERIGLFGGSFDPVHLGHLLVAQAAREELELARLFLIPAAQSPFKPDRAPTPAPERLRLLRLAFAGMDWCEIDDQEIKRGGVSFTIDSVRDYHDRFPRAQLFYLIGADHVAQLPKWREAAALVKLADFVVIPRPGEGEVSAAPDQPVPAKKLKSRTRGETESRSAAAVFPAPFRGRRLNGFPLAVSSSQIRARVKAGLPITHLVPAAVAEAIRDNRLYL